MHLPHNMKDPKSQIHVCAGLGCIFVFLDATISTFPYRLMSVPFITITIYRKIIGSIHRRQFIHYHFFSKCTIIPIFIFKLSRKIEENLLGRQRLLIIYIGTVAGKIVKITSTTMKQGG